MRHFYVAHGSIGSMIFLYFSSSPRQGRACQKGHIGEASYARHQHAGSFAKLRSVCPWCINEQAGHLFLRQSYRFIQKGRSASWARVHEDDASERAVSRSYNQIGSD